MRSSPQLTAAHFAHIHTPHLVVVGLLYAIHYTICSVFSILCASLLRASHPHIACVRIVKTQVRCALRDNNDETRFSIRSCILSGKRGRRGARGARGKHRAAPHRAATIYSTGVTPPRIGFTMVALIVPPRDGHMLLFMKQPHHRKRLKLLLRGKVYAQWRIMVGRKFQIGSVVRFLLE